MWYESRFQPCTAMRGLSGSSFALTAKFGALETKAQETDIRLRVRMSVECIVAIRVNRILWKNVS